MSLFSLREINGLDEMEGLITKLRSKMPLSLPVIVSLQTKICHPQVPLRAFVPADEEKAFSLVILTDVFPVALPLRQFVCIFWDNENISEEDLAGFLQNVPHWDWKDSFQLGFVTDLLATTLERILRGDPKLFGNSLTVEDDPHTYLTLAEEDMTDVSVPSGYKIRKLLPNHLEYIHSTWPHKDVVEATTFRQHQKDMPSVGAFEANENESTATPASFVIHYCAGIIGLTYTKEEHKKKGLASAVEVELAKQLFAKNCIPAVCIQEDNIPSKKLHAKLGFMEHTMKGGFFSFRKDCSTDEA